MQQLLLVIHFLSCISLVILILLQHGKGADIGAAFGSGASNTLFGSQGSGSFLLKLTGLLGAVFFTTSIVLGYVATRHVKQENNLIAPITKAAEQQVPVNFGLTDEGSATENQTNSVNSDNQNPVAPSAPEDATDKNQNSLK